MKRSKHNLSNYKLLSMDLGELVPIGLLEVLPGDTIQHACNSLIRCSPLIAPVMHPVNVNIHHWFVPLRLIWEDWEDFITGGPDGDDASVYPTITHGGGSGVAIGSLADYLGVPPGVNNLVTSALPFRAYSLIWNHWYRDQDLQTELTIDLTSGADTTTNTALQNGCWEKDRFTSARPWEQKGTAVTVPLGTTAPLILNPASGAINPSKVRDSADGTLVGSTGTLSQEATTGDLIQTTGALNRTLDVTGHTLADLSNATAASINDLREAFAIQRYMEARARWGSRYTEYLAYLGVQAQDARLQLPEYLGGGRSTIQFSEVLQTAEGTDPVGNLAGHGISGLRSYRYRKFFAEHGYLLSLMVVRPKTMYMQGLAKTWNRRVKEDYFQVELAHIGQEEILNKEIYAAHATPDGTFGYQDRYDDYRRQESTISGEFRDTLDFWHFARDFGSTPALNADFVKSVPTERTFAVPSADVLYVMARHRIQARRLVPRTGNSFIF